MTASEIFVGSVAVGVVPSAQGFAERVRSQVVPSADSIGAEFGGKLTEGINGRAGDFMTKWGVEQSKQASRAGADTGTTYAESFRNKIEEILRNLPEAKVGANTTEAQEQVNKLRAELESLKSKEIGVDLTNKEAMTRVDEIRGNLARLTDHPSMVSLEANIGQATARVEELRTLASKPIVVPIEVVSEGTPVASAGKAGEAAAGASAAKSVESDMAAAGENAGTSFGSRFGSRVRSLIGAQSESMATTREGMIEKLKDAGSEAGGEFGSVFSGVLGTVMKAGVPLAIIGAAVAISAVMGERLEMSQKQLEVQLKAGGQSWEDWKDKVTDAGNQMSKFGYTQDQVDKSLRAVYSITGNMNMALKSQAVIADLAASQHISLADATNQYDKALVGNARSLKQMGIVMASGATDSAAMASAQKILASQIDSAGGMAKFAAMHHMSLAAATRLVAQATGPATGAVADLEKHNLNAASASKLLTAAQSGNSAALKTLTKDHLSLHQLQGLVTASTQGNIAAFNKLGIDVLPKSNTAAQNFAETNRLLEMRMGGQAQAVAESFGGKIAALRARFTDVAMEVGTRVMPYLGRLIDMIMAAIPVVERWTGKFAEFIKPALGIFLKGIGDVMHVLTTGPMKKLELGVVALIAAWFALDAVMAINPFVALAIAIIFIIGLIDKYHKQIVAGLVGALHEVENAWHTGWSAVANFFKDRWDAVTGTLRSELGFVEDSISKSLHWVRDTWNAGWSAVYNFFHDRWVAMDNTLLGALNWIRGTISSALRWIRDTWDSSWTWVHNFLDSILRGIESLLDGTYRWMENATRNSLDFVHNVWNSFWSGVRNLTSSAINWLKNGFNTFFGWLNRSFQSAVDSVRRIWGAIQNIAAGPVRFIINTVYNHGIVPVVDAIAGVVGLKPMHALPGFARGTGSAPPGWAWVGERGPELVRMTGGEIVLPHEYSMATGFAGPGYVNGTGSPPITVVPGSPGGGGGGLQQIGPHGLKTIQGTDPGNAAVNVVKTGLKGLQLLIGDALGAAIDKIVNPLIDRMPDMNTKMGQYYKKDITWAEKQMVDWIIGQTSGAVGSGSGSSVAAYAKSFATGRNHPYVTGGATPQGWDCSGFSAYVYDHFGYFPGKQGTRYGTSESQWADTAHLQSSGAVPGALAFFDGTGYAPPGHVGVVINPRQYASAYDHAEGTVIKNIAASAGRVWGYRVPKGGFQAPGAGAFAAASFGSGSVGTYQRYAQSLFPRYGWGANQMGPLILLWNKESGWNPNARNPSSGAAGIPQDISGNFHGGYQGQIQWGENYIHGRYGNPANAWSHETRYNWYANGTPGASPGWAWVGERGMELVKFRGGEQVMSHEDSMKALKQIPGVGYWNGTVGHPSHGEMGSAQAEFKTALRDVEKKLDKLTRATQGVGGDVAANLDSTGRIAGHRGAFSTGR